MKRIWHCYFYIYSSQSGLKKYKISFEISFYRTPEGLVNTVEDETNSNYCSQNTRTFPLL
jgi:hypothetical protein